MGRSRRRARTAAATTATAAPRAAERKRAAATASVAPAQLRKTLGAYLAGAIVLAIVVLLGTVALAPAWAPWVVLAVDAVATIALYQWAQSRLAGLPLSDEDRILQTLAGGLLAIVFLFAAVAAVVLTVA